MRIGVLVGVAVALSLMGTSACSEEPVPDKPPGIVEDDTAADDATTADDFDVDAALAELDASEESKNKERRALAEALVARGDAGSLATAAMVYHELGEAERAVELARTAAEAAHDGPHLAWLWLSLCVSHESCDADAASRRFSTVDPGNGATVLHQEPEQPASPASINQFLQRLGQAERVDLYWSRLLVTGYDAIEAVDGRLVEHDDERYDAFEDVVSAVADVGITAFSGVTQACRGDAVSDSTRRDVCLRVARALQNGDTTLAEALGLALEKYAWEPGTAEYRAVVERREKLRDLQRGAQPFSDDPDWRGPMMESMRKHRTEQQAIRATVLEYRARSGGSIWTNPFTSASATKVSALTDEAGISAEEVMSSGATSTTNGAAGEGRTMHLQPLDVNFLAVLVAGASALLLGGLWYSHALFGLTWNREAGLPVEKRPHRPQVFATGFVLSLIAAWLFAAILPASVTIAQATLFGAIVGAAWVATSFGINYGFGDRSLKLWLIDGGYHTLQFALYGVILAAWR